MAVSQSYTNHETFQLFMSQLIEKLSEEDENWRENSIVTLD